MDKITTANFDYTTSTWTFGGKRDTVNGFTFMEAGYISARANGLVATFSMDEVQHALMWVETKCGVSSYKFVATDCAIL